MLLQPCSLRKAAFHCLPFRCSGEARAALPPPIVEPMPRRALQFDPQSWEQGWGLEVHARCSRMGLAELAQQVAAAAYAACVPASHAISWQLRRQLGVSCQMHSLAINQASI